MNEMDIDMVTSSDEGNIGNNESDGESLDSALDYISDDVDKRNDLNIEEVEEDNNNEEKNPKQSKDNSQIIERRSLRPSNQFKKLVYTKEVNNDADSDQEVNIEQEDFNQQCLVSCLHALKTFFYKRLEQVIIELGGKSESLHGYKIQILKKTGGLNIGVIDVFYYSTKNKRYRSRIEVACALGLMIFTKNIRSMTREQHYINAIETREKHLLSQQLATCNFKCDEIVYDNDLIEVISSSSSCLGKNVGIEASVVEKEEGNIDDLGIKKGGYDSYLSVGNITVLDWGRITPLSAFHNSLQIFPIGFKCLRQEHDVVLDRVVDCLCEVVGVYDGQENQLVPSNSPLYTSNATMKGTNKSNIIPIFRISIAWQIPQLPLVNTDSVDRTVIVRVYEGKTPQQAWQAAMLETVGTNPIVQTLGTDVEVDASLDEGIITDGPNDLTKVTANTDGTLLPSIQPLNTNVSATVSSIYNEPDEEENQLRAKVREQRRVYFRLIRGEQSAGTQSAMKPRFFIDPSESFMDELLMRLVEGMEGSISCHNYAYFDTREKEAGKKNAIKAYAKLFTKSKSLDRVIRRNMYIIEQLQQIGFKRRRIDDIVDLRKRPRFDDRDNIKSLSSLNIKHRATKVKELEKNIYHLKYLVTKYVKRRRDDAKIMAEIVSEREESIRCNKGKATLVKPEESVTSIVGTTENMNQMDATESASVVLSQSNVIRPENICNAIVIDGFVFGQLIEINEFLKSFSKTLDIKEVPGIDYLVQLARVCDPSFKSIQSYTQGLHHTYDNVLSQQVLNPLPSKAHEVFDSIGIVLTKQLIAEYERIHGFDQLEQQVGMFHIPVNALTWKEIARAIFLSTCCKEIGIGDNDITGLMKGKGFFTSPDPLDRKTLKIARRRIKFGYVTRDEHQESVYGFNSGVCVHIPAPTSPYPQEGILWTTLIGSLQQIPDTCGWLIFEIIKAAAFSVCVIDTTAAARRLKRALLDCLCLTSFRMNNGKSAKIRALQILAIEINTCLEWKNHVNDEMYYQITPTSNGIVSIITKNEYDVNHVHVDNSIITGKTGLKSLYDQLKLVYDQSPYMVPLSTFDLWQKQLRESLRYATVKTKAEGFEEIEEEILVETDDTVNVEQVVPTSSGIDPVITLNEQSLENLSIDVIQAEKLSVAMQRCYIVIRDLMINPQANPFLWPVDSRFLPTYNQFIPQPLSLSEVRCALVEGQYQDSIFKFYSDVIFVLENAMAFNPENSVVKISAQKLLIIFERIFFETVLYWENPLPYHDCCHGCRVGLPLEGTKIVICDRCEAGYHLQCLEPPLHTAPRSEWYCLPCIEQKGIANAHPFKTADVYHPNDPDARGEVVGIEQMRQTLMFVVEFGSIREMWDGRKVRQYAIEPTLLPSEDALESKESLIVNESNEMVDKSDQMIIEKEEVLSVSVYQMPSGYDYEDYDRVCGIARAYVGWGSSHYLVPSVIMDEHNSNAKIKSKLDITFQQYRSSIAALGPSAGGVLNDELSMYEWSHVLTTLIRKILDSSAMSTELLEIEEKVDDDLIAQLQEGIETQTLPLEKIFQLLKGEGLVKRKLEHTIITPLVQPSAAITIGNTTNNKKRTNVKANDKNSKSKRVSNASTVPDSDDDEEDEDVNEDEDDEGFDDDESIEEEVNSDKKKKHLNDEDSEDDFNIETNRLSTATSPEDPSIQKTANHDDDDDDDDELEFFDENGNCLTSSIENPSNLHRDDLNMIESPVESSSGIILNSKEDNNQEIFTPSKLTMINNNKALVPRKKESQKDWVKRLLSRKKGREDAYLIKLLTEDIIKELDIDGKTFIEDIGSDFYPIALSSIIKICTNRPGATIAEDDWFIGWDTKFNTLVCHESDQVSSQKDKMLCPICGFDEVFIANPFVYGQTAQEWEADVLANKVSDVLFEPEPYLESTAYEYTAFPLAAGISVSIGIKGFKARHRVMKGLAWLPCNTEDAELELKEYQQQNRTICTGTWPMHEFCAHFLHFNRQLNKDRSLKAENQRILEIISGLGRAKSTPIGIDHEGTFYWILKDSKYLYTSTGGIETLRDNLIHKATHSNLLDVNQNIIANKHQRWSIYMTDIEILDIICWLNDEIPEERMLKRILNILYPSLNEMLQKRIHTSNTSSTMDIVIDTKHFINDNEDLDVENNINISQQEQQVLTIKSKSEKIDTIDNDNDDDESIEEEIFMNELKLEEKKKTDILLQKKNISNDSNKYNFNTLMNINDHSSMIIKETIEENDIQKLSYMSNLSMRPALKYRNKLLDQYYPVTTTTNVTSTSTTVSTSMNDDMNQTLSSTTTNTNNNFLYRKGEHVLVDASPLNHILWDARIIECKIAKFHSTSSLNPFVTREEDSKYMEKEVVKEECILYYKVRFDRWGSAYDGWYEQSQIISPNTTYSQLNGKVKITGKNLALDSKIEYLKENVWTPPEILKTLQAYQYMNHSDRESSTSSSSTNSSNNTGLINQRPPLTYSDCYHSTIGKLRYAMLIIESALPKGCIDESDDRWGDNFVLSWREAVMIANDATSLMQCQIMLEYGIKTAWLKPIGLKIFSCLASRNHAMRTATYGMVAIRIWALDAMIKYDKVVSNNILNNITSTNGSVTTNATASIAINTTNNDKAKNNKTEGTKSRPSKSKHE